MVKSGKLSIIVLWGIIVSTATVFAQTAEQNAYARFMKTGSEQLKTGDYQAARESFEQALRYDDSAFDCHLGLGIAFFHLRDDRYAESELSKALELNPKASIAYRFLGELYYRKDNLEMAISSWEKAVELNPAAADIRERLDRIRREHRAEKDFNRDVTGHFLAKYEGREKIEAGRIVLRILEDAYGEVGRSLSYYPDREIQVILYSGKQFREVTDAPGWSGAIYDGKIRLPIGGIDQETPGLRRLLYHEYTHAVVRAITPRCPTWLNEGLAQYFEGTQIDSRQQDMLKQLALAGKLPALKNLDGSFTGLGSGQAQLAYLFSLSIVRYTVDAFGMYRVRGMLDEFSRGADSDKAISNTITMSSEEFQNGWKRSLE